MNNNDLIGQIRYSKFKYYDLATNSMKFKSRPVLIIGTEKESGPCDLTVLPISSITRKENFIDGYDIEIKLSEFPNTGLSPKYSSSYCRTSKISTVSSFDLSANTSCQLNTTYPNLYNDIKTAYSSYQETLF